MYVTFRYIEAVTPVLAELHPSAIVDGLHFQCSNEVKAQNRLKVNLLFEHVLNCDEAFLLIGFAFQFHTQHGNLYASTFA